MNRVVAGLLCPVVAGCLVNADLHREQRARFDCLDEVLEQEEALGIPEEARSTIEDIPAQCERLVVRTLYADCDGDRFGDPDNTIVAGEGTVPDAPDCGPDSSGTWTLDDLDCDDSDPASGGRAGVCPDAFAVEHLLIRSGETELLVAATSSPSSTSSATILCQTWAGEGGLASLHETSVRNDVVLDLEGTVWESFPDLIEVFVDAATEGDAWTWPNGSVVGLPFCDNTPPDLGTLPAAVQDDPTLLRLVLRLDPAQSAPCVTLSAPTATLANGFVCQRDALQPSMP